MEEEEEKEDVVHRDRVISKTFKKELTRTDGRFPDSTLRGNAELGDNNQVQVALVINLCLARE